MSDEKRSKALRTIASLQRLIDHPNTGDGEREAARGRITVLREKYQITETKSKPRVTTTKSTWWFDESAPTSATAEEIRRQADAYAAFLIREAQKKQADASRKQWEAERAARRKREEAERKRRAEAQKRWEERNRSRDARGVPLTDAEREEARRDPLAWALKQDGRTAQEKNDEMQNRHKPHALRCEPKATFYDEGGEPRKRNQYPTDCYSCGSPLRIREGALFKVAGKWVAVCCEAVPGPRKKKPGRS